MICGVAFYSCTLGVLHSIMHNLDTRKEHIENKIKVKLKLTQFIPYYR